MILSYRVFLCIYVRLHVVKLGNHKVSFFLIDFQDTVQDSELSGNVQKQAYYNNAIYKGEIEGLHMAIRRLHTKVQDPKASS